MEAETEIENLARGFIERGWGIAQSAADKKTMVNILTHRTHMDRTQAEVTADRLVAVLQRSLANLRQGIETVQEKA